MTTSNEDILDILLKIVENEDDLFDMNRTFREVEHIKKIVKTLPCDEAEVTRDEFNLDYNAFETYLKMRLNQGGLSKEAVPMTEYPGSIYPFYAWQKDKVLYRFDPDIENILVGQDSEINLDDSMKMPCAILERLPHQTFFVSTRTSPYIWNKNKRIRKAHKDSQLGMGKQIGFVLCYSDVFQYTDTDRYMKIVTGRKNLMIFVITYVVEERGRSGLTVFPISLFCDDDSTLREALEGYLGDGQGTDSAYGIDYPLAVSVVKWAFQYILYLCAENAEIEQEPKNAAMYRKATPGFVKNKPRETLILDAGTKTGPMIHAFKEKRRERSVSPNAANGSMKSPHVRRAHWHHYWTGKRDGERRLVLKWVAPSYIHKELYEVMRPSIAIVKK